MWLIDQRFLRIKAYKRVADLESGLAARKKRVPLAVGRNRTWRSPADSPHFTARDVGGSSRARKSRLMREASQSFAVQSLLTVTIRDPSGLNAADQTPSVWPLSVRISAPLFASHTFAVLSQLAVTIRDRSGLNDAEETT
jgi:hypothetical protein